LVIERSTAAHSDTPFTTAAITHYLLQEHETQPKNSSTHFYLKAIINKKEKKNMQIVKGGKETTKHAICSKGYFNQRTQNSIDITKFKKEKGEKKDTAHTLSLLRGNAALPFLGLAVVRVSTGPDSSTPSAVSSTVSGSSTSAARAATRAWLVLDLGSLWKVKWTHLEEGFKTRGQKEKVLERGL